MNYENETSIGTPDHGFGVYSPQTERCAIRGSKLFRRWSDCILRVAGWGKGVFIRGLRRSRAGKPARTCDGVYTRSKLKRKQLRYIHRITFVSMSFFMISLLFAEFLPLFVRILLIVPLGLFCSWCMVVSFVRVIQEVTGQNDLKEIAKELKKEDW